MQHKILIPILFTFLMMGCISRIEFTPAIQEEIERNGEDLSKVQYYNSDDILLVRELEYSKINVTKGIVIEKNGKYLNQIRITKNTPGILIRKEGRNKLFISFENGLFLPFEKPKYYGNYFKLSHDRMDRGDYYVEYDGNEYKIIGKSKLLYRPLKRRRIKSKYHTAKGMKVDDHPFNFKSKIDEVKSNRATKKKAKEKLEGKKKSKEQKSKDTEKKKKKKQSKDAMSDASKPPKEKKKKERKKKTSKDN